MKRRRYALENAMRERGLNRTEVATLINVTPTHISKILSDKKRTSREKEEILSAFFDIPREELFKATEKISKNRFEIRGDTTAIYLPRKDGSELETLIDTEDLDRIKKHQNVWYALYARTTRSFYVRSYSEGKKIALHRVIMKCDDKQLVIDHINHDTLDNRKANLRMVSQAINMQNMKTEAPYNKSTGLRGVSLHKQTGKYQAGAIINGKHYYLGIHSTIAGAEDARQSFKESRIPFLK